MNPQVKIEVIDKDGWRKEFSFQKSLFHIGSAAMNDLVLENARGGGVAARHAQLIALPDGSGFRLVNLGDSDILLNEAGDKRASPHSVASVSDGSVIKVGDFTLIFHGEAMLVAAAPADSRSSHIGLRLSLPRTQLAPHQNVTGVVAVANHGDLTGVQFDLDLEGLEPECYTIEPAPLLPSGTEREVALRIFHRGNKPLAGDHTVTIRAVAPDAYPGEEASVTCTIQVQPFYKHTLRPAGSGQLSAVSPQPEVASPPKGPARRVDDLLPPPVAARPVAPPAPERQPALTLKAVPTPEVQPTPPKAIPTSPPAEDWWTVPEAVSGQPAAVSPQPEVEPEAPTPGRVEAAMEPAAETVSEAPAAPPVETWETAPEPVAAVIAAVEQPATPITEPKSAVSKQGAAVSGQLSAISEQPAAISEQPEKVAPAADDWWGAPEEPRIPETPIKTIAPTPQAEPAPETEATPPPADDWWSEPEKENTPPVANADWWSA
ncbi:MAG TPA: hypothetical protein PKZ84_07155 [Anaerolineae bacterium]|nr:hypothetical protein [Anaerolineae bacterium]HQI84251.1 hypothetical protein [Anaerolineae bacterium]